MSTKAEICNHISFLKKSASDRGTNQGILVCDKTLEAMLKARSNSEVFEILLNFNQSYFGIESHGHLTDAEFEAVKSLRKIYEIFRESS